MWSRRLAAKVMPRGSFYGARLTRKGKRFLRKFAVGAIAFIIGATGLALNASINLTQAAGAFLLGLSIPIVTWAYKSNSSEYKDLDEEVGAMAELELLHGRLNAISAKLGLETIDLGTQLHDTLAVRKERIAHYAGVEEHRPELREGTLGWRYWGLPNVEGRD